MSGPLVGWLVLGLSLHSPRGCGGGIGCFLGVSQSRKSRICGHSADKLPVKSSTFGLYIRDAMQLVPENFIQGAKWDSLCPDQPTSIAVPSFVPFAAAPRQQRISRSDMIKEPGGSHLPLGGHGLGRSG